MPTTAGPIYPGIKNGLVFAIDPANKDSYPGTGTVCTDLKNPSITGTMSGVEFSTNNGGVFNFDGADSISSFTVSNSYSIFSVGVWIKPNSFSSFARIIELNSSNKRFLGLHSDGKLISGYNDGSWDEKFTTSTLNTDTWYYIVMVDNGTNTIIYVNDTANTIANSAPTNTNYDIGSYGAQNYIDAEIGPIQVYNRALSASEVLKNITRVSTKTRINNFFIIDYLVVAGGASGGGGRLNGNASGGGGAGGVRTSFGSTSGGGASSESSTSTDIGISFTVTVGAGGAINEAGSAGNDGNNSVFSTITSIGGGGGGGAISDQAGRDGGSGGGGGSTGGNPGSGTANQGFDGGDHGTSANYRGGGGGGASEAGGSGTASGDGGNGLDLSSILGTSVGDNGVFGGGGSGGVFHYFVNPGSGGTGGGGTGGDGGNSSTPTTNATAGTANTGGGGGGAPSPSSGGTTFFPSGAGGSGIVILRYPSIRTISIGAGLTSSTSTSGDFKITVFTAGTDTISFS